jgi:hypothetical protein
MLALDYLRLASLTSLVPGMLASAVKDQEVFRLPQYFPIPGGTSFEFCPESKPDTDLFTVDRIIWDPDPPRM